MTAEALEVGQWAFTEGKGPIPSYGLQGVTLENG